jgi:FHS family L-fucose permease-like MFS transporter
MERTVHRTTAEKDAPSAGGGSLIGRAELVVLLGIFALYGAANSLNHLLIHQFMHVFRVTRLQVSSLQSAYYFGYVAAALPAAAMVRRRGSKASLLLGVASFAASALLMAALIPSGHFAWALPPVFLLAASVSVLESTAGPYALRSIPGEQGVERLTLAQAFNSLGMIAGATIGTFVVFPKADETSWTLAQDAHHALEPFVVLAAGALVLLYFLRRQRFADIVTRTHLERVALLAPLRSRRFVLVLFTAFVYMGTQTCAWSFLLQYLRQYGVTSDRHASFFFVLSMACFALGRFAQTALLRRTHAVRMLALTALGGLLCTLCVVFAPGRLGAVMLVLVSLFMAGIYPMLFALGVQPMGNDAQAAGSLMVFGLIAGGIAPPLMALLARASHSYAIAYLLPCLGFLWVLGFARYVAREANGASA